MELQMRIQLETCKIMITASKALAQDISSNTKGELNKIPSMHKKMLSEINLEYRKIPSKEISTQGIEIFGTKIDTEAYSILEILINF